MLIRGAVLAGATVVLAALAVAVGPCGGKSAPKLATTPLAEGATLGRIEKGAAGDQKVHTLLSVSCDSGKMTVRTNLELITGSTDCSKTPPQAALDRYLGQPAILTYGGGVLHVQGQSGASLDISISDPMLSAINATP